MRSRLTIDITAAQHQQIKTLAALEGMTVKDLILAKTLIAQNREAVGTTDRLLGSPKNAARLLESITTPTPPNLIFESTVELRQALGI